MALGAIERLESQATPTAIAHELGMKSSNVAKLLGELAADSLIEKKADADDRRKTRLSITDTGAKLVSEQRCQRDAWLAEAIKTALSYDEQESLLMLIPLLDKITGRKSGHRK
ncbi:winged helix DNA-binding protein [Asaia siamensis]